MEVLVERIKQLCKSRSISVSMLENKLDLPSNTIYQWKKRVPGTDKLKKIADYFDTSIDYLLGRTDTPNPTAAQEHMPDDLDEMLDNAMTFGGKPLTEKDREAIRAYVEGRQSLK